MVAALFRSSKLLFISDKVYNFKLFRLDIANMAYYQGSRRFYFLKIFVWKIFKDYNHFFFEVREPCILLGHYCDLLQKYMKKVLKKLEQWIRLKPKTSILNVEKELSKIPKKIIIFLKMTQFYCVKLVSIYHVEIEKIFFISLQNVYSSF